MRACEEIKNIDAAILGYATERESIQLRCMRDALRDVYTLIATAGMLGIAVQPLKMVSIQTRHIKEVFAVAALFKVAEVACHELLIAPVQNLLSLRQRCVDQLRFEHVQ